MPVEGVLSVDDDKIISIFYKIETKISLLLIFPTLADGSLTRLHIIEYVSLDYNEFIVNISLPVDNNYLIVIESQT